MHKEQNLRERVFPTTHWSEVERVGEEDAAGPRPALEGLLRRYLPALRTHLLLRGRVRGGDVDDALQGFISGKILEQDLIGRADQTKGRFRALLLMSLDRYVVSQHRYRVAEKRDERSNLRLDDVNAGSFTRSGAATDSFDSAWARELLNEAMRRLREECEATHRGEIWGVFEHQILAPMVHGQRALSYAELVESFGFQSPGQLWHVTRTAKRMFAAAVRAVVGEYASDEEEIEQEIADLHRILSRPGAA